MRNPIPLASLKLGMLVLGSSLLAATPGSAQVDNNNLVRCAQENGYCRVPFPTNVFFGVPGRTVGKPLPQGGGIACTLQAFGRDPAPNVPKTCSYAQPLGARDGRGEGRREGRGGDGYDRRERDYDGPRGGYDRRGDGYDRRDSYDRRGDGYREPPRRDRRDRSYDED